MDDLLWWLGGSVIFILMFDLALVGMKRKSISYKINERFGLDPSRAIFWAVLGGLFVHFTNWRPREEDGNKELFEEKQNE